MQSLGTTSITFGHSLSLHDQMLAKITRIFVRQNVNTGKPLTVSDQERSGCFSLLEPNNNNGLPVVPSMSQSPTEWQRHRAVQRPVRRRIVEWHPRESWALCPTPPSFSISSASSTNTLVEKCAQTTVVVVVFQPQCPETWLVQHHG